MITYNSYIMEIQASLETMTVTDINGDEIKPEEGITRWCKITKMVKKSNDVIFFIGNGASAMMAGHMAADASKNGELRSMAFNDAALMTAVSNDIAFEDCFSVPLRRFANSNDILITISSSGNSPNIIRAIDTARQLKLQVVTLSGMKTDNRSRKMGDLNFYIPADTYGVVEASHQVLLHCWLDKFIEEEKKS
jgi:D-sedoheptulose 7-phosphate isomerase